MNSTFNRTDSERVICVSIGASEEFDRRSNVRKLVERTEDIGIFRAINLVEEPSEHSALRDGVPL